jgi:uncharacterized protein YcbX
MEMTRTPSPARIDSIYRYPVKGLTPEPLPRAELKPGQTLSADRRYAIENGPSSFNPVAPAWLSKAYFLMLMRDEWLAALRSHFDDATHMLTIRHNGKVAVQGNLETAEGRAAIENFFATSFAGQIKGPPKVLSSPGHSFSDVARKVVSIINLASVRAIENMVGAPVHPLALPRQCLCRGLAGLVRIRPPRSNAGGRRRQAESGQAHRPLRRHQCRP